MTLNDLGLPGVVSGGGAAPHGASTPGLQAPPPLLPFGPTLHFRGCGCPYSWAAGCRLCDWGDSWLQQAHSRLSPAPEPGSGGGVADPDRLAPVRPLKVAYCLPHAAVTGGLKILLEHMRLLRARGHCVVALTRSEVADSAVPPWASDVAVDADVVCRAGQRFRDVYDVDSCDVVVTGIFHQIPEWLTTTTAPVLYYEQGHEWLFGDPLRFREAGGARDQDALFHATMHLPVALAAVSEAVQSIICREFGRSCMLVHNGVDCARFRPGPPDVELLAAPTRTLGPAPPPGERRPTVLLVGNPGLALKGFDCALAALAAAHRRRPLEVHWVCQQEPGPAAAAAIQAAGLRVCLHVDPPQHLLPALYRGHDCFLFTSQYEAWGMPVLEAMASGLPVVCTATAGVSSFATRSLDCLMAAPGDAPELAHAVLSVLEDAQLAARLAAAARQTALAFTPERAVQELERVLYSLAACRQELAALRLQALPDARMAATAAVKACAGVAAAQQAQLRARREQDRQRQEEAAAGEEERRRSNQSVRSEGSAADGQQPAPRRSSYQQRRSLQLQEQRRREQQQAGLQQQEGPLQAALQELPVVSQQSAQHQQQAGPQQTAQQQVPVGQQQTAQQQVPVGQQQPVHEQREGERQAERQRGVQEQPRGQPGEGPLHRRQQLEQEVQARAGTGTRQHSETLEPRPEERVGAACGGPSGTAHAAVEQTASCTQPLPPAQHAQAAPLGASPHLGFAAAGLTASDGPCSHALASPGTAAGRDLRAARRQPPLFLPDHGDAMFGLYSSPPAARLRF